MYSLLRIWELNVTVYLVDPFLNSTILGLMV